MQENFPHAKTAVHNANRWELETHSYKSFHYRLVLLLREIIRLAPNRVLELGCGVGVLRAELLKTFGARIDYYGVDISESAVRCINDTHVVTADLNRQFPFDRESFDVILGSGIMEYIENLRIFFGRLTGVLGRMDIFLLAT